MAKRRTLSEIDTVLKNQIAEAEREVHAAERAAELATANMQCAYTRLNTLKDIAIRMAQKVVK